MSAKHKEDGWCILQIIWTEALAGGGGEEDLQVALVEGHVGVGGVGEDACVLIDVVGGVSG